MFIKEFIIPFATGLALFLFGMQIMRIGFENLFLEKLKYYLYHLTKTPFLGLVTGTFSSALLQSSSAVTLITIAPVSYTHLTLPTKA